MSFVVFRLLDKTSGIEHILTKSHDYDELAYAWTKWRDATGLKLRTLYNEYVDLGNEAARFNGKIMTKTYIIIFIQNTVFKDS